MSRLYRFICIICASTMCSSKDIAALVDLEEMSQEFVLESGQIIVDDYPNAFNPSITRWKDNLILSFRQRDPLNNAVTGIGLVFLDEKLHPCSATIDVHFQHEKTTLPFGFNLLTPYVQDPRLIVLNDTLYMAYSNVLSCFGKQVRRMFVGRVAFSSDNTATVEEPLALVEFKGVGRQPQEKNWSPFIYRYNILLSANLVPHEVIQPIKQRHCPTVGSTEGNVTWEWGGLRGGTQAILEGKHYLGFFHSSKVLPTVQSKGKRMQHYFMGAYLFASTPPFKLTHISPEPIFGKGFYTGPEYKTWKPLRVIFPGGYITDEKYIWIVYGKQDHEMWWVKLDKQQLLDSLIEVETKQANWTQQNSLTHSFLDG